jgi:hypothetical protein
MMEVLTQTGMLAVLVLLSEGVFVLSGALGHGDAPAIKSTARVEFVAGVILCTLAVTLLYSLGRRDEK